MQWITLVGIFVAIVCMQLIVFVVYTWIHGLVQKIKMANADSKVITKVGFYRSATSASEDTENSLLETKDDYI